VRDDEHDAFGEELSEQPLRNPLAALTPVASPVHDQQAEIAERFAAHDEDGEDADGEYVDETAELYDVSRPSPGAGGAGRHRWQVRRAPSQRAAPAGARPRAAPGSKAKAAFTLRLDPSRHLKLRLACAVDGRSAQHW
jgi:hypothetical protein